MRVVAALGGNAFAAKGETLSMAGQLRFARQAIQGLTAFFAPGVEVVVTHGNGPQVGHSILRVERSKPEAYELPLDTCVAQTQGELGHALSVALQATLPPTRETVTVLTHVEVDLSDPAFQNPTKPIGSFYDAARAEALRKQGFSVREDAGRGFRRVVASPKPKAILEASIIGQLMRAGVVVVAGGGGGIPVVRTPHGLVGVEAVIDKDLTSALLADALEADLLVIVTNVPHAYTDYRTPTQAPVGLIEASVARRLLDAKRFGEPGSMAPKIEACTNFATKPGRKAIVCELSNLAASLRGDAGTVVVPTS